MTLDLPSQLAKFTDPEDEQHLRSLEEVVASLGSTPLNRDDIRAIFDLFERFPEEDGYGIFWSLLHAIEASGGYEADLLESVARQPGDFNVRMVGRFLNAGRTHLEGQDLFLLLKGLSVRTDIPPLARETSLEILANQNVP